MARLATRLAGLAPVVLLLAAGALAGLALVRAPAVHAAPPTRVSVAGVNVDLSADLHAQAVAIGRAFLRTEVTLRAPGRTVRRSRWDFGARVDLGRLEALLRTAADPRSVLRRAHTQLAGRRPLALPVPVEVRTEASLALLQKLADALDRPVVEPRMDTTTQTLEPEKVGLRFDVWSTLDRLTGALHDGTTTVDAVVQRLQPHLTARTLGDLSTAAVLGHFETHYNPSDAERARTHNLKVAAAKIDGLILMPGQELDFNRVVGERSQANGFVPAPQIADGELVDGVGGGACQIASTLHGAVFFAGLPILERHPHSRPSHYILLGLDAAVSYPTLNFRFRNDRSFPIVIGFEVDGGIARATLWGRRQDLMVSFVRSIAEVMPFEERTKDDPSLPDGVRVLAQRGVPGFRVQRWRILRNVNAHQAVREAGQDIYPPTAQIWRVGTGGPAPEGYAPPTKDPPPEYVADEFYSLTRGPGAHDEIERRRAGRTGTYGWIEREGLAKPTH